QISPAELPKLTCVVASFGLSASAIASASTSRPALWWRSAMASWVIIQFEDPPALRTTLIRRLATRAAMPAEIASVIERVTVRAVTEAAADHEVTGEAPILTEVDRPTANSVRAPSACPKRFCPRDEPAALRCNDESLDQTINVGMAV